MVMMMINGPLKTTKKKQTRKASIKSFTVRKTIHTGREMQKICKRWLLLLKPIVHEFESLHIFAKGVIPMTEFVYGIPD